VSEEWVLRSQSPDLLRTAVQACPRAVIVVGTVPVQRGQCAGSVIAGPSTRGHAGGHVRRDEAVRSEHVGGDRFPTVPKTWHPGKNPARHDRVPGAVAGQAVQASAVAQSHQKRWASRADWASSAQSSSSAASVMP
jgi:hypothetical protein